MSKGGSTDIASESISLANPITEYKKQTGLYPNNAEQWWAFKRPTEVGTDRPARGYLEVFDPGLRHQFALGNTPAPRGHFIFDVFYKDRSALSGVSGLALETSGANRPWTTAFYAGRVFYSGVRAREFNTKVYFSQIIENQNQVGDCFQAADPTAEDIRELQPSDGGVLEIPEAAQILHMEVVGVLLMVFATNGVWAIAGSDGLGFRANDFSVVKVSDVNCLSSLSFVTAEGAVFFWNRSDINVILLDQGSPSIQSISDDNIRDLIESIPTESKRYVKGAYDPLTKEIQWLYRSLAPTSAAERFSYDSLAVYDVVTGGFTKFGMNPVSTLEVNGIFNIAGEATSTSNANVLVGSDSVLASTNTVVVQVFETEALASVFKYIVNILDELEANLPVTPPEGVPPATNNVLVVSDNVLVNTDQVIVFA